MLHSYILHINFSRSPNPNRLVITRSTDRPSAPNTVINTPLDDYEDSGSASNTSINGLSLHTPPNGVMIIDNNTDRNDDY